MSTFVTSQTRALRVSAVEYRQFDESPAMVLVHFAEKDGHGLAPEVTLFLEPETAGQLLAGVAVALGEHAIACRAAGAEVLA
ncbi:hypothetical protein [Nocardia niigatensis]|uniref:hypothetical protein n=1 Tax=Nocardia niigatensis TaxID=209249 RepID=UPI0002F009D6|nr:hypothetical protein [Nocardia niigatensis]